jgi:aspartate racemase
MSEIAKRIAGLSPERQELLARLLKQEQVNVSKALLIARPREVNRFPLSFAQQRLWFLNQLEPESAFYNVPEVTCLHGRLNVEALERSLTEVVRRHEALRTTFDMVDEEPVQIITPPPALPMLEVMDLSDLPEATRRAEAERLVNEEAGRSFDLARGPLLRTKLLRLGEEEHVLLLTMHHIISDGWSLDILARELATLYAAFSDGRDLPLADLPIQYADFAVWQREWLSGEVLKEQLAYWKKQLSGQLPILELPADRSRPAVQTHRGATETVQLSRATNERLKEVGRQNGATLFMTLLAAFNALLYRYTGQEEIIVGTPIANRNRAEIEPLIGFFVNTLALKTELSGRTSFQELLKRVREVTLGAYAHQDLPFEKLVEELHPERGRSRMPLFQVMFVLQNATTEEWTLPGLTSEAWEFENTTSKFDLILAVGENEEMLVLTLQYDTDLLDAALIKRMLGHLQTLLLGIIADPEARLSALPLLSESEERQLLVEWNQTRREYPRQQSVHQLFEAQVERTPEAVALICGGQQVSYRALNERANQLANYLRERGVGAEVLVGVMVERSVEMVVALLGILKAGGAYVPLDPEYPLERLSFMIQDARMPVLLTQKHLVENLPVRQAHVVCLDSEGPLIARQSTQNMVNRAQAQNLAYVIYTSGSTGIPKGVAVTHRAVLRLLCNVDYVHLDSSQSLLQFAPLAFDASTFELWGALLHGARCILYPHRRATARQLQSVIKEHGVRTMWLTAALYNTVMDEWAEALAGVEQLLIGGEALSVAHVRAGVESLAGTQIINGYGPTETTTFACSYRITGEREAEWAGRVPIGRPIANTEVYVLDQQMGVVPIGVTGELYIGGDGLARGYLHRAELTAERFVPHPYSQRGGARLYRTGDMVRYIGSGEVEFIGRTDEQVKLRGYRIELGEIEAVLARHNGVREAVVLAREDELGEKRLVAYVVGAGEVEAEVDELRNYLKERLPQYMVPSGYVSLQQMPLTASGKVDRRALHALNEIKFEQQERFIGPRDTLELKLAQIWEEVLDVRPIGVKDNFFDLGGHSLLAVRLMARIHKSLEKELPVATLLQTQTIEGLAKVVRQQSSPLPWSSLMAIQPLGSPPPFFCVHPAGGNVLCYFDLARRLGTEQPFYGLQSQGLDGKMRPHSRIEDLAAAYIEALQAIQTEGPYLLGGWSMGGSIAFEMAQQLSRQGQQVALLALFDSQAPLTAPPIADIDEESLLRQFAWDLERLLGAELALTLDELSQRGPEEQLPYLLEQAIKSNALPPDLALVQLNGLFQVFKANVRAMLSYEPRLYSGRIVLFQASEPLAGAAENYTKGWAELAAQGVELRPVPGNHYTMIKEPHVRVLAESLSACFDQTLAVK